MGTTALPEALAASAVAFRPSGEELHRLAAAAPGARVTGYGSVNVRTRVTARCRRSTFWVSDSAEAPSGATMSRAEAARFAKMQDDHLAAAGAIVVDGYLGAWGQLRLPVRVVTEAAAAPIAAMQRHLLFDPVEGSAAFTPQLTIVSTPHAVVSGAPDGCLVAVWRDEGVTRVAGTDFFGETKKAVTRLWSERVYDAGGLVLHAACLVVLTPQGPRTIVVVGPPDSGKSTLAFGGAAGGRLVQDDFVAVLPGGHVVPAENGCIEKTGRLDPDTQPVLHSAATGPDAYLENVVQRGRRVHFIAHDAPQHARCVFPLRSVGGIADTPVPPVGILVILDPGDPLAPALARLDTSQTVAHFLLRERRQGLAEPTGRQGNRLSDVLATCTEHVAAVVNTAAAGEDAPRIARVNLNGALVAALADGDLEWVFDADLRTLVAGRVRGVADPEMLWPRRRCERLGVLADYAAWAEATRAERRTYLSQFAGLDRSVVAAVT